MQALWWVTHPKVVRILSVCVVCAVIALVCAVPAGGQPVLEPTNPVVISTSHTVNVWSNDNMVDVEWSGATGDTAVDGYSILWDTSSTAVPDTTINVAHTTDPHAATSPELADGDSHFFHLRTCDTSGHWTSTIHLGPFKIDTTPPAFISWPADLAVECAGNVPAHDVGSVVAEDNWGNVTITWQGDVEDRSAVPATITRTYRATDGCGNYRDIAQTITLTETDTDGDGTPDCIDYCPLDPLKTELGQCGCDVEDIDTDGDGVADCLDQCPLDATKAVPGQCGCGTLDTDTDGDGTADCDDQCPDDPNKIWKGICGCGNPEDDSDEDGYPDCIDNCIWDPDKTSPGACGCGIADTDADKDGVLDCNDDCKYDPLKIVPGICGCGIPDVDSDGDGTYDCFDGCPRDSFKTSAGVCGCGVKDIDSDHDTYLDCQEACPQDPLKVLPGVCGCGTSDIDSDGDGTYDCDDGCPDDPEKVEPGRCGCGEIDIVFDSDFDCVLDCNDGCPRDPNKIDPGICGCFVSDTDTDGDGTLDCNDNCPTDPDKTNDTDTDEDGTLDCNDGCPYDPNRLTPGECGCGTADVDADPPTITLDALVPDPTVDSTPTFTGTVSDPNYVTDIFYRTRKNGGAWSDWVALTGLTCTASANFSFELGPLADGVYDVAAKASDDLGNTTAEADYVGDTFIVAVPPIVKSVDVSGTPICDAGAPGTATFEVTVDFDEAMDTGVDPTLIFNPGVATTLTLNTGQSGWMDNDTYVAKYDVSDGNVDHDSVTIDVIGAQDAAGNGQEDYTPESEFEIDTLNPTITSITSTTPDGYYGSGSINVTVSFSEEVTLVGGTLDVTLDSGATISISSFGPATSVSTTYVVGAGENSCDLDATDITLKGTTLQDRAGNDADMRFPTTTIADGSDIAVDTTDPVISDLTVSNETVDANCEATVTFSATVTDNCCVMLGTVTVDVTLPTGNATLGVPVINKVQNDQGQVSVTGSVQVSDLNGCPATVQVTLDATDCCANVATQVSDTGDVTDTSIPVINDLSFYTDSTYAITTNDYHVDDCCLTTVYFAANVTDQCCVHPNGTTVDVTLPTNNAVLENIVVSRYQNGLGRVDVTGSADVRCLTSCPARVEIHIEATDCCGNAATPVTSIETEGRVYDNTPPPAVNDPNGDEERSTSDNLEVRLSDDGLHRLMVRQDTPVQIDVVANDTDNCSTCTCSKHLWIDKIVAGPKHGTATIEDAESVVSDPGTSIRYAPHHGYYGDDEFTYQVIDACGNTTDATVCIEVVAETAMDDTHLTTCVGTAVSFDVTATDLWIDPDNPGAIPFLFSILTPPMHGVISGDLGAVTYATAPGGIGSAEIALIYTPATGFVGRDAITLQIADPFGGSSSAMVDIAVIECVGQPSQPPLFALQQGEIFSLIVPLTFASVYETAWDTVMLIAETDSAAYQGTLSAIWDASIGRYILTLEAASLPPGQYQMTIPLGNGETVTLMIEVSKAI